MGESLGHNKNKVAAGQKALVSVQLVQLARRERLVRARPFFFHKKLCFGQFSASFRVCYGGCYCCAVGSLSSNFRARVQSGPCLNPGR